MKSSSILILSLFFVTTAFAELDTLWTQTLPLDPAASVVGAAVVLQDGKTMAASPISSGGAIQLFRVSAVGEVEWSGQIFVPSSYVVTTGLVQMDEGHLIMSLVYYDDQDSANVFALVGLTTAGDALWIQTYSFGAFFWESGVAKLSDNTVAVYTTLFDSQGSGRATLLKFDSAGDTLWTRNVLPNGASGSFGTAICELAGGDLVLGGYYESPSFNYEGFVIRATPLGVPIWTNTYSGQDFGLAISCLDRDSQDNIVAGGSNGSPFWFATPWGVGITADGAPRWTLNPTEGMSFTVAGIRQSFDGGAVLVGSSESDFGQINGVMISVQNDGEINNTYIVPSLYSSIEGLHNSGTLGAVAFGGLYSEDNVFSGLLIRFGSGTSVNGFVRDQATNAPLRNARVEFLETGAYALTDQQGIYFLGVNQTTGTLRVTHPCASTTQLDVVLNEGEENTRNFALTKPDYFNGISSINSVATFGIPERDTLRLVNSGTGDLYFRVTIEEQEPAYGWLLVEPAQGTIAPGTTGEVVVTVLADGSRPESEFFGEVVIHHNDCTDSLDEVGIYTLALDSPEPPAVVTEFTVDPVYPNPFNNTARVAFELPRQANVDARLYTIEGREALVLASSSFGAGRHELIIEGNSLATGLYLLRLSAASSVSTQKLILLK
ncbi:MAG: T9SS type A sorting domain-containing protein [Calditrichaeota bacterium]|nr:T9SS type A sorting domain-containing protein [Calditrichota bacterium]MCB9365637.1 T9SS type A sorting domain-containing protein [Calditrichota bacterium]